MIDLNDVWSPPPRVDLAAVKAQLCRDGRRLAAGPLPAGAPRARPADAALRRPLGPAAAERGLLRPASRRALRRLGLRLRDRRAGRPGRPDLPRHRADRRRALRGGGPSRAHGPASASAPRPKPDHTLEVRRILDGCRPLAGSPAETYLRSRGLTDPGSPDLLYHPDLTDYDGARGWPGMVAVPRMADGAPIGGIHRTFLLDDGSGKAPPGKKMLGSVADGAVRLFPIGDDGHLGIAEGIETALVGAGDLRRPGLGRALGRRRARAGSGRPASGASRSSPTPATPGVQAAARLAERLTAAGIPNEIVAPLHGDDFNDDLQRGAVAADYGRAPDAADAGRRRRPLPVSRAPPRSAPSSKPRPRR